MLTNLSLKSGKLLYLIEDNISKEINLDLSKLKSGNFYMITISSTNTSGMGILIPLNSKSFRATVNYSSGAVNPLVISAEIDKNLLSLIGDLKTVNGVVITELIFL